MNDAQAAVQSAQHVVAGRRRLLSGLRGELLNTVSSLVGHCQILCDDIVADDAPPEVSADLRKMLAASKQLYGFVKQTIAPDWPEVATDSFDERLQQARHDAANKLNHALGLCQLLLLQDQVQYFGALIDDLQAIESKCRSCVATLQRYKDVDLADGSEAEAFPQALGTGVREETASAAKAAADDSTVLVVDDSQANREQLKRFLEGQGHTVDVAGDGREALEVLKSRDYDLVLLDLVMPGMNGFDVLRELKKCERLQHTPVIIVSGIVETEHVVSCIEMGAEDHLPKPVDFRLLTARVNSCLEKRRLREREFAQFFTPELARHFVRHPELLKRGQDTSVTVMFCDIRGFSRISERLGPTETVSWLSDVMARLSDCVIRHRGVLVDYIGDELMAMWGAPEKLPNHAALACHAALDMLDVLPAINERWGEHIQESTEVGIGLNSGFARVGNTGSDRKFKYGPLGNTVNLASRVQGATKYLGTNLLITGDTFDGLDDTFPVRRLCKVRVVNIEHPVDLYEVRPSEPETSRSQRQHYELALNHFEQQELNQATSSLAELLVNHPNDGPSVLLMSRVLDLLLHRSHGFDPVWELPGK